MSDIFQSFTTGLMTGQQQSDRRRTRAAQDEAARMLREGNPTGASQALMAGGLYGEAATMSGVARQNRADDARVEAGRRWMTDPKGAAGVMMGAGQIDEGRAFYSDGVRREAGSALAEDDSRRAAAIAAAGGDVEMATQLVDWADRADERERAEAVERARVMAPVLIDISRLPYEQRRAAVQARATALGGIGFTPEQIAGFDPTDENIRALTDSQLGLEKLLGSFSQREVGDDLRTYNTNPYGVREVAREPIPVTREEQRQEERLDLERERLERTPPINSAGDVLGPLLQRYSQGEPLTPEEQTLVDRYLAGGQQSMGGWGAPAPLPGVNLGQSSRPNDNLPGTSHPAPRAPAADPFPGISEGETVTQNGVRYRRQGNQMVPLG